MYRDLLAYFIIGFLGYLWLVKSITRKYFGADIFLARFVFLFWCLLFWPVEFILSIWGLIVSFSKSNTSGSQKD